MLAARRSSVALLFLFLLPLAACSPAGELSGAADPGGGAVAVDEGAQERASRGVEGPVEALEGFDGEPEPWGARNGDRVEPLPGYTLEGVAEPAAVLVLDKDLAAEVGAVVREFSASGTGNRQSGEAGTAIYMAERFSGDGGLGTTRFRLVGSAKGVVPGR